MLLIKQPRYKLFTISNTVKAKYHHKYMHALILTLKSIIDHCNISDSLNCFSLSECKYKVNKMSQPGQSFWVELQNNDVSSSVVKHSLPILYCTVRISKQHFCELGHEWSFFYFDFDYTILWNQSLFIKDSVYRNICIKSKLMQ